MGAADTIQRIVSTVYTTVDQASGPAQAIANQAIQTRNLLMQAVAPVTAMIAGYASASGLRQMVEMQSAAEGTRLAIAGTLRAYDAVGESMAAINARSASGSAQWIADQHAAFQQAQTASAQVIDLINRESAVLPGSAEDYVQVYRTALPGALEAGMTNIQEVARFTSDFAATAAANQIDSAQAGHDMLMILQGRAGAQVRTWMTLQPLIGKSAEQFNHMTAPARAEALKHALERYKPLLNEFNNTWDAIYGTTTAYMMQMARGATMPLFEKIKTIFNSINELIGANAASIATFGANVSTFLVGGIDKAIAAALRLKDVIAATGLSIIRSPWFGRLYNLGRTLGGIANRTVHNGTAMGGAARLAGAAGALGPYGMAVGPLLAFATHTRAVNTTLDALAMALNSIATGIEPLLNVFGMFNNILGDILAGVLPGVAIALNYIVEPLMELWAGLSGVAAFVMMELRPHLARLSAAVGHMAGAMGQFLAPIIRLLGHLLIWLYQRLASSLIPKINMVIDGLTLLYDGIAWFLSRIGRALALIPGAGPPGSATAPGAAEAALNSLVAQMEHLGHSTAEVAAEIHGNATTAAHATPRQRGGSHTHNDFRNSRFSIEQRFAEGFDPDRVATAFVSQLERQASQRLQGGLEPAFGMT